MLGLHVGSVVSADTLVELLWGEDPPRTAAKALQTHISSLRRTLGDGFVLTEGAGWTLAESEIDASRYKSAARRGRDAAAAGDTGQAVARFEEALELWRGIPELPDGRRGTSEKTRWIEGHAALVEDRADALLATGRAAEIIGELEAAVADAPLRERRWAQLMLALYRAGRQGEALGAYQRARTLLADELGVDPGPELRRLEAAIVAQDAALETPGAQNVPSVTRAVTFLLTDIEGSTAAWEADAGAMGVALARHDELVEQVVTSRGGRLIKTRGEGDATFSVFERPSAAAAAALELQDAITHEPWALREPMRVRVALHTGEAEFRDGDYFGRAVNRAARLRSLAAGGQILCSGATAELVIDSLPDDVALADLGTRQLRNLARPEHVFELRLETAEDHGAEVPGEAPLERPGLPAVLAGPGPFVGRGQELERLFSAWQTALAGGTNAVLIAGEPGVGKTRLAGEWSRQAYDQGALVIYGRCDEDLGAPYQPFAEALRSLVPCLGSSRLRELRGVEALLPLVPGLTDVLPDLATPTRADPDTERYALFDAVVALLGVASASAPVVLILDDLHWAAKPTLLLLRHLLRFGERARVQIIGTYRSTDLDRSHPLSAMLADLHRDGTANRLQLSGLDEDDVSAYVAEAGYNDEELARALASVTGGNPFFLIEALRHVEESGGRWDPSTLPQGVREAVSRRLSRLSPETNKALAAAAVVGSRFALELVERVVGDDLVDPFDEACKAGIVIEEPGGRYRFNHALVRQSLLAELPSVRRMRLHQRIATTLENEPGADDELLAELAHHYFECAWAGNAVKAVEYCRRAADQAMARLAYEGAADLYDRALHALEEIDDELPDRDDQIAELLIARCEALLAAGDVASAAGAVSQLQSATVDSARLAAWATCFDGQLSMLTDPERLDEIETAVGTAAATLAQLGDAAGEATAHTVRAGCLARLGRIGDCEIALDDALTAARRAREHRRVNAVLANAPLAALWGPNPVPRAGGRCLDVVRLLRITTDSPAVEATSTRCQAVLEAFRGRAAAARRMIDSARRTVTELGLRHALLEVEQFAGIVELVVDDPAAAEPHLRKACNGFRRMGLDADTAETAALLGRACLLLDREAEADELCTESERLAGHALKASIAWRTLRARLLSRAGHHGEARRVAEEAVSLAERTDALVDHGDACLSLATVLGVGGDAAGARAAAERALGLYERKGAAALAEKARGILGERGRPTTLSPPEPPTVELDNACVRAGEHMIDAIARQAWDEIAQLYSPNAVIESRRKIVGFARFTSGDWVPAQRPLVEAGDMRISQTVIAVRGNLLTLSRLRVESADLSPGAPYDEFLSLYGIDEEGRFDLQVWFDVDDMDAAVTELDVAHARFGEEQPSAPRLENAATRAYERVPPVAEAPPEPPSVEIDNAAVRVGERVMAAVHRGAWDEVEQLFAPDISIENRRKVVGLTLPSEEWRRGWRREVETSGMRVKHVMVAARGERLALARMQAGTEDVGPGAPYDELLHLYAIDEQGRVALQMFFDVEDMDAALAELDAAAARFEAAHPRSPLENAASRADDRIIALFASRCWEELGALLADEIRVDDRRRGFGRESNDRATEVANLRAIADLGAVRIDATPLAIRGDRLCLNRLRFEGQDARSEAQGADELLVEALSITQVDADGLILARTHFDSDDFDAAIKELDARYCAGEAAAYSRTWSVITGAYAALNRHEIAATTTDFASIDHRRGTKFMPGDLVAYVRATWELAQDGSTYIEAVHQLDNLGAVVTHVTRGTSREGFEAEWREAFLLAVQGDLLSRCELFDESDVDTAIARFEHLSRPTRRLENAASKVAERFLERFADRDWDAMTEIFADDFVSEDRRRVVGAGIRHGRDVEIASIRAGYDLGGTNMTSTTIATRGARLILTRTRHSGPDQAPEGFLVDSLAVVEINTDNRIAARVVFEPENMDAAFQELDTLYLAGEAAPHAHTWSVVSAVFAALKRHEMSPTTSDFVDVDRRRLAVETGGFEAYLRAIWDVTDYVSVYITAVHRLTELGAVVTHASHATSHEGLNAEWQNVNLLTFDGDLLSRVELFDEEDLDAALTRFEQLTQPAPRLENTASRMLERYFARFAARDWDVMAETLTDDFLTDDRRRVVNAGVRRGRDAEIANMQSFADIGIVNIAPTTIATRGERLVLCRHDVSFRDWAEAYDVISVVEITDTQISAHVMFDANDIDAAIAELDTRYLAGEAAANGQTWSVIAGAYAAANEHELRLTPDCITIDHRRTRAFAPGELTEYMRATWDLAPGVRTHVEAVHRLNSLGAVVTHAAHGTSKEGFDAEWREVIVLTIDGDLINRSELFDEAELDAALARFEQLSRPAPRLDNAASHALEQWLAHFATRDWDAMAALVADDYYGDDRRPVFGAGIQRGGDVMVRQFKTAADLDVTRAASDVVATRGNRVALTHTLFSRIDDGPDAFRVDVLYVVEINADERISALVAFDSSQSEAAIQELDARYLAGEASAYARTWSIITGVYAALNRREIAATTADFVSIDHRRGPKFAPGDLIAYVRASWDLAQDGRTHIETVHRLNNLGAVLTHVVHGTSQDGFEAEWREVVLLTVDDDLIRRSEMFDESDLDTAITRFEQLHPSTPQLENTATRVFERLYADIAAHEWDAVGQTSAENVSVDDRRRVVNAGVRLGRDDAIEATQATVDIGFTMTVVGALATRGDRIALTRVRVSGRDPEAVQNDALSIVEIDADDRIVAIVVFDLDDTDAAFAELDARYLTGEAAAHARSWSVIAGVFVAHNRRELPATTPDAVSIDHRRGAAFAPGEGFEYIRAGWDLDQNLNIYIETAHRLNDLGAVFTWTGHGTSREGFDAEWRGVTLMTVDGEMLSRMEVFDEADLDSALARFDQLNRPAPQLENEASRAYERFRTYFAARDWAAMAELLTADTSVDDHRRVVNAETRRGRDVEIANMRAFADIGAKTSTATVIATRGERLVLCRTCISSEDNHAEGFRIEMLIIVETSPDKRILARAAYDPEDIEAAFAELDARYLTGEAAAHARTWSVLLQAYAALNKHEMPSTTPDWVNIDHRRGASFASGEMPALLDAAWNLTTDLRHSIEAVHRLNDLGAVVTNTSHETSHDGFDAEWRVITIGTVEGDMLSRTEVFDEADLDVALARFDELTQQAPRLENVATRVWERLYSYMAAGDWHAVTQLTCENASVDDRRRVVNAGILHGRDANIKAAQATVEVGFTMTMVGVLAIRGTRLALTRVRVSGREPEAIQNDSLSIVEIDADERIVGVVVLDLDATNAAVAELDARYLAGEAAPHAHTWTLVAGLYATLNRHELPQTTPDFVDIDHRRLAAFAPGDMVEFARTAFDQLPDISFRIEAVHRLSNLGAVVTQALRGTSREGFEAEWREIHLTMVDGDQFSHSEIFDEADLEAALARFEELHAPRLANAASRMYVRFNTYLAARDWDAMAEMITDDILSDDRRRVVSAGIQRGRDAQTANLRAIVDVGVKNFESSVIATRGERLVLTRARVSGDERPEAFGSELLSVIEIDTDNRIAAGILFDLDDIDAAFEELEVRYLAGEAAAHAQTWSLITRACAAFNHHELPATTPDSIYIDHRPVVTIEAVDLDEFTRATRDLAPGVRIHIEAVHSLRDLGAVVTLTASGISQNGFDAEWRMVDMFTVDGDLISRNELFDEADLDAALERFDELSRPALKNPASEAYERICRYLDARDWDAVADLCTEDVTVDDRRRVVNAGLRTGRDAAVADLQVAAQIGFTYKMLNVIATRGGRLALMRVRASGRDPDTIANDAPNVVELDSDGRISAAVVFDLEDIDAAFAELDARYLAGEAAAYSRTWSVIAGGHAGFNGQEAAATTPDVVYIDRRPVVSLEGVELSAAQRAVWDLTPNATGYVEVVHRLSELGTVITQAVTGTSREGFTAEWRMIAVCMVEGDLLCRYEVFDEADLDAALARFDELQPQARLVENAASQVVQRFWTCLATRDWEAMAETMADDFSSHDHRRVVNAGVLRGRDVNIANMRAVDEVGFEGLTSTVIATRGERLALSRIRSSAEGLEAGEISAEMLGVFEIDADNRLTGGGIFDAEDIDAAFAELDSRYLAGEAGAHAQTWSAIARACARFNRHELPATTPDWVTVDHRPVATFEAGDLAAFLSATWDLMPHASIYIEAVHRLNNLGAVVTHAVQGISQQGSHVEWRQIGILTVDGERLSRSEIFDEADLDAVLARFEELQPQAPRLENAATRIIARYQACFTARDWAAMAELLADDIVADDRRHVVNAGVRRGRDVHIADNEATVEVSAPTFSSSVIATRGARLALAHVRTFNRGMTGEVGAEALGIAEIDVDERIVAMVMFDPDDTDAAFEELDTRYLAGEAAAYAHTWSVIAPICAAFNRKELFATTPDPIYIDHRPLVSIEGADLAASIRAVWDLTSKATVRIEAVHQLSERGAVFTEVLNMTSREGFDAEMRMIMMFTVEGDLISGVEVFDEENLGAALTHFEELQPQTPRPENAASQAAERFFAYLATHNWAPMADILADDSFSDDRRRVVNAGLWQSRDIVIAKLRETTDYGVAIAISGIIATRGRRLVLSCVRWSANDEGPEAFPSEALCVTEIEADNRIAAIIMFDPDDTDAAFEELDARYLAGEAATHAHTLGLVTRAYAALNRRQLPEAAADWVNIDHRRLAPIPAGGLSAYLLATWDLSPQSGIRIEAVHRLSKVGAVVTQVVKGTSHHGFEAEWRTIDLSIYDGDKIKRTELFDEDDLDAALARFDELNRPPPLENKATRTWSRMADATNHRDMEGFLALTAADLRYEDRRKGLRDEFRGPARQKAVQAMFDSIPISVRVTADPIAIRGSRLSLIHVCYRDTDYSDRPVTVEFLQVAEVDDDGLMRYGVSFDTDEVDAAFEELNSRYLAGEAAAHSHTWSAIVRIFAAFNRHELYPTTADWVNADHRQGIAFAPGGMTAYLRAGMDLTPDTPTYIETVHRLSDFGVVLTHVMKGTSQEGFDAEWREIGILTVDGELISRCELFDEADIDAALARFDELNRPG